MFRFRPEDDDIFSVLVLDKTSSSASTKEFEAVHSLRLKNGNLKGRLAHRKANGGFNFNIDREAHGFNSIVFYSSIFISIDIIRQICSYGLKYFNNDVYPIPQTFLVFFCEFAKLLVFFFKMAYERSLKNVTLSFRYMVPSTLYAINNNIYFLALYYTTPPMWNILMQGRIICTALVYRGVFKKKFTGTQWVALMMMMVAIVLTQFSHAESTGGAGDSDNLTMGLVLALIGSLIASVGPIYTEYLLKNDKRSFDDKQLQLYMFGSIVTGMIGVCQVYLVGGDEDNSFSYYGNELLLNSLAFCAVIFAVGSGITTAFIMKKLDNIVKLYAQSMSTIMTTMVCVWIFPRKFHFDGIFIVCLILTVAAIFLYETGDWSKIEGKFQSLVQKIRMSNLESRWHIICMKYLLSFLLIGTTAVLLIVVILQDYFGFSFYAS